MGEEVLYTSHRTRVYRRIALDGHGTVVCKRATGSGAVRRIEHEQAVLRRLAGIPGVPRLAAHQARQLLIVEDDDASTPVNTRLPIASLVQTARELAATLAAVHRAGVVHRDVTPANVILPSTGRPVLIDYDLALVDSPAADPASAGGLIGTLGYLAPEQTGRTGLAVDCRADLYGLGATLYALAVGTPPFPGDDALEVVRDTLVRVPVAPAGRRSDVPRRLSEIIMRLLEKDPDCRYQSAEGLAHDLARCATDPDGQWRLGERDFPAFLSAPARLVGRDREIRLLAGALDRALTGDGPAMLVTGPPGIGKSALVQTLRPAVTERGGWFVAGKFDQFRTGTGSGGITRAVCLLGRLLLAEPEPEAADDRQRLLTALGPNAAVATAAIPELAAFIGRQDPPQSGDPAAAPTRAGATVVALLRALAVRHRIVFVLDDLQWAGSVSLQILDAIVCAGPIPGFLLLATYRDEEVSGEHPLTSLAARWQRDGQAGPPVRLTNLSRDGLAELAGAVLRMTPESASGLATALEAGSGGNPYGTVEVLNALRAEGLLALAEEGWWWDPDAVRAFVSRHRVPQMLAARLKQQPGATRRLSAALACLGGEVRPEFLAAAVAAPRTVLIQQLAPAITDGLIAVSGAGTVQFRHDLIHRAAREILPRDDQDRLQLAMARRLARCADYQQEAAEQYLAVTSLVQTPRERRSAAALLHAAGRRTAQMTNYPVADELLDAAGRLLDSIPGSRDAPARNAIAVDRHATLYCTGRLAEADQIYRDLAARSPALLTLADATAIQINSLTQRGECRAAIALGLEVLHRFGIELPDDLASDVRKETAELREWVNRVLAPAGEQGHRAAEATDPRILAVGRLINRLLPAAFQRDPLLHAWLVLQAYRLWQRDGVCAPVIGTVGAAICVTIDQYDDYHTGYLLTRYVVAVGRERGYQAETGIAWYMHLFLAAHWFEPLEEIGEIAQQARDDLLAAGDVQVAGLLSARLLTVVLETTDSLETCADEISAALAFAERTGNRSARCTILGSRQLVRALRGETAGPGLFASGDFDEVAVLDELRSYPPSLATYHINRALGALLFHDADALDRHSAAAMAHSRAVRGFYVSALARFIRCLSLAARLREQGEGSDADSIAELADAREWLARRAADSPRNFGPLLRLVDAEREWALGDPAAAARHFDAGLHEVAGRPWHRALLAERAARFHLGQGFTYTARSLLVEARDTYRAWGADGRLAQLETEHPFLRVVVTNGSDSGSGTDRIDLMGILRASQALSSQTSLAGLEAQVGDVLSAMTGATDVRLALRHRKMSSWYMTAIAGPGPVSSGAEAVTDPEAGARTGDSRLPLSAVRYVLRTRQPLLVADATRDDRFARDPYFAGLGTCALLVVPIPSRNVEGAVLVLENHRQRGVFSTDRLAAVQLVAGQLAVSLDNALLYDSLENTVRTRTADLAATNGRLAKSERRLRSHFEHAAVGQVIHGLDDRIEEANPSFLVMTGRTLRQLEGKKLADQFEPADRAAHRRDLEAVASGRQRLIDRELVLLRTGGRRLDVRVTVSAVPDEAGRPAHLVSFFQDISRRKAAEAARDAAHLELADRNQELEAANQLKADLIGMLGHEINNPLATILGNLDLLLAEETLAPQDHDVVAKVYRTTQRLATIVNEVLALVSLDAGRLTATPSVVRVADHVEAVLAATGTTGVAVSCPRDLNAEVQPSHLDQILTNLVSNAAKYGGGVTAIIVQGPDEAGGEDRPVVTIEIRDEGPGVPPEFRDHLFDRFARAEPTAGKVAGTGLGLYIVRELARANDGDVRYRPAPVRGSSFILTLPSAAAAVADLSTSSYERVPG
ncbi:AAA family ATPase [Actinoplanes aureus]|uniref:histidine kinase n=1 Tax=Actinoplanes aureus TaxID=2792083 RepID=A0A931CER2_9ACTN|nr:AAA family ATPase [Actinoplanes aureus]MBG0563560.1 AAA family ATPase [Actinoplanes aureus]